MRAVLAQSVECILGKDEVGGSNPLDSLQMALKMNRIFKVIFYYMECLCNKRYCSGKDVCAKKFAANGRLFRC